jgi:hypothetical protein
MSPFVVRWFASVALLPMLATCSPEPAAREDAAPTRAAAEAEARLAAFLIDGSR